jgi:hypothetical protein
VEIAAALPIFSPRSFCLDVGQTYGTTTAVREGEWNTELFSFFSLLKGWKKTASTVGS